MNKPISKESFGGYTNSFRLFRVNINSSKKLGWNVNSSARILLLGQIKSVPDCLKLSWFFDSVEILQSNVPRDTSSDSLPKLSKQEELQLEQENQELLNELLGIEQQVK